MEVEDFSFVSNIQSILAGQNSPVSSTRLTVLQKLPLLSHVIVDVSFMVLCCCSTLQIYSKFNKVINCDRSTLLLFMLAFIGLEK